jgi:hypothetical protein
MKRFVVNLLAVAACLILCAGCSSLQPSPEPRAAAVTTPAQKQVSVPHDYPMAWFVRGWLLGEAPPPDFHEGIDKRGWGWLYIIGIMLEGIGPCLNK